MKKERSYFEDKVIYERDIHKSYLKMLAAEESTFDERTMLRRKIEGILPCQKCYINGMGQYWYDISGKQALDSYCKVNVLEELFLEKLILEICNQAELMEWNLLDENCLLLNPEFIFVNQKEDRFFFTLYPKPKEDFFVGLQKLMEYLLTKLNHEEKEEVQRGYAIYEIMLKDGYSLTDLKEYILRKRAEKIVVPKKEIPMETKPIEKKEGDMNYDEIEEKLSKLLQRAKDILNQKIQEWKGHKNEKKEMPPVIVYPEEVEESPQIEIHPTICLTSAVREPQGKLLYDGMEGYPDFEMNHQLCVIGKSPKVKLRIARDTISHFHAKIDWHEEGYYIEDMNSTNGTFVNEELLNYKESRKLNSGDVIRFADVKYRFL